MFTKNSKFVCCKGAREKVSIRPFMCKPFVLWLYRALPVNINIQCSNIALNTYDMLLIFVAFKELGENTSEGLRTT